MRAIQPAFTLIELIIVISIIAILAAALFVAIDPARRLHEARNARRWSDVSTILEAIKKDQADDGGTYIGAVSGITDDRYVIIGTDTNDDGLCAEETTASAACANTQTDTGTADCADIIDANGTGGGHGLAAYYLASVPYDPSTGSATDTQYWIFKSADGYITIGACDEEAEGAGGGGTTPTIELTR